MTPEIEKYHRPTSDPVLASASGSPSSKLESLLEKITKLPWKEGGRGQEGLHSLRICAGGFVIGDVWYQTASNYAPRRENAEANADYLVHAANVLPQLIEAMRRQCADIYHPDLLEALQIAEGKMENSDCNSND